MVIYSHKAVVVSGENRFLKEIPSGGLQSIQIPLLSHWAFLFLTYLRPLTSYNHYFPLPKTSTAALLVTQTYCPDI